MANKYEKVWIAGTYESTDSAGVWRTPCVFASKENAMKYAERAGFTVKVGGDDFGTHTVIFRHVRNDHVFMHLAEKTLF